MFRVAFCMVVLCLAAKETRAFGWDRVDVEDKCLYGRIMRAFRGAYYYSVVDTDYRLYCQAVPNGAQAEGCYWTDFVNDVNESFAFECPNNQVLAGVKSSYDDATNDRRFALECCGITNSTVHNCEFRLGQRTIDDDDFKFISTQGTVVTGFISRFNKDAKWRTKWFKECQLRPAVETCTVLTDGVLG